MNLPTKVSYYLKAIEKAESLEVAKREARLALRLIEKEQGK